ncbi:50S ribosomal protein L4 [Patescibacteria group bacterium]|nr:50S ribosomal protein L4 [Patescibacteria group bacterium]
MNYIVPVVDTNGKELVSITLDATVFAQDHVNTDLIHEYVLMQLANARQSNAHTKTR